MGPFDLSEIGHLVLLSTGLFGASLYMLVTLSQRMRLRRVLMTFRSRWITPNSGVAGIVLAGTAATSVWSLTVGTATSPVVFLGYTLASAFWLAAALIDQLVVVTDYGLVTDLRRSDRSVAWGQILDYFVRGAGGRRRYVFLHADEELDPERLTITVPASCERSFREIVDEKLDARYEFGLERVYGRSSPG